MVEKLAEIPSSSDLYDYRLDGNSHLPLWLPYNQGDIFAGVSLPGIESDSDDNFAMLFMHPCTMREGVRLTQRVTMVQVRRKHATKVLDEPRYWKSPKVMPLPDLPGGGVSTHFADFMLISTVDSTVIPRDARVAQLSALGRHHMLQRIIFHLTRSAPSIDTIESSVLRVQAELALQADWVAAAAGDGVNELSEEQVQGYEASYQRYLDEPWDEDIPEEGDTIRSRLHSENLDEHVEANALVSTAIEEGRPQATK